jgi:hypothetical protein
MVSAFSQPRGFIKAAIPGYPAIILVPKRSKPILGSPPIPVNSSRALELDAAWEDRHGGYSTGTNEDTDIGWTDRDHSQILRNGRETRHMEAVGKGG